MSVTPSLAPGLQVDYAGDGGALITLTAPLRQGGANNATYFYAFISAASLSQLENQTDVWNTSAETVVQAGAQPGIFNLAVTEGRWYRFRAWVVTSVSRGQRVLGSSMLMGTGSTSLAPC